MQAWKRINPTIVSKIGWRTIVSKTFQMPDGKVKDFQTLSDERTHTAAIIALTKDNKVIIARQFRPGPEKIMDELPGGGVESGEDIAVAAARELKEETGYVPGKLESLGKFYRSAYSNTEAHYFLATDCELVDAVQTLDEGEHIDVHLLNISEVIANAKQGRMTDTGAILLAFEELTQRQERS